MSSHRARYRSSTTTTKLVRITTNNQVAIPAFIVRDLGLNRGTYLEVQEQGWKIVMTPKRFVDAEDFAMYKAVIEKGRLQLRRGQTVAWDDVKKKLDRQRKAA
jgi:AbrB family looped-hinge helix DNA binding protein